MAFYRNIFIATGTVAFVYIMMKLFANISGKSSKKASKECEKRVEEQNDKCDVDKVEIIEPESVKNIEKESAKVKPKSIKRKLNESASTMKILRPRPNFFMAFQVSDVGIHQKVKKIQEKLVLKNPKLFPAVVNVSTLHITLAVTHLANENDINVVKNKLDAWAEKNIEKYFNEPCILSFRGVKTFNNVVAYVDIEQDNNYKKIFDLAESFNNILSSAGYTTSKQAFKPHLTFLKLSKDSKLFSLKRRFNDDFEALKECSDHFGKQKITHIQLLSMDEPKDKFGYYKCYHQIKVSDTDLNTDDHTECCTPIPKPKSR